MKGILFKPDMIAAIDSGQKTMTRRVESCLSDFNDDPNAYNFEKILYSNKLGYSNAFFAPESKTCLLGKRPKYETGDIIYIREPFRVPRDFDSLSPANITAAPIEYKYGGTKNCIGNKILNPGKWRSPLHLPVKFARKFLKITDVRVERLKDISDSDCISEGIKIQKENIEGVWYEKYNSPLKTLVTSDPYESFKTLWQSINGNKSWELDPWVFIYEFERCNKDGQPIEETPLASCHNN
ncbi:hypothetical protein [Plebeiibacterium sediminum]|uniref:Uncharacterized protein n=1 Tax=Plebeiibacterium sediminum TaxID=2992112 RepID=A0AAE3M155_9BACT|nr:hypothetical protein [Plebeiobacterium sediminum]MCW3784902.1 hypothetical protein [Plebeiobacterium sediminum]